MARRILAQLLLTCFVVLSVILPASAQGFDIERFRNNSFGAYQQAIEEKKYAIILFETDLCVFCKNLLKNVQDGVIAKYGNDAIFSVTDDEKDEGAAQLVEALGVIRYPTLVILRANPDNIHVSGRIEGEVPPLEIDRVFHEAMKEPIQ